MLTGLKSLMLCQNIYKKLWKFTSLEIRMLKKQPQMQSMLLTLNSMKKLDLKKQLCLQFQAKGVQWLNINFTGQKILSKKMQTQKKLKMKLMHLLLIFMKMLIRLMEPLEILSPVVKVKKMQTAFQQVNCWESC